MFINHDFSRKRRAEAESNFSIQIRSACTDLSAAGGKLLQQRKTIFLSVPVDCIAVVNFPFFSGLFVIGE